MKFEGFDGPEFKLSSRARRHFPTLSQSSDGELLRSTSLWKALTYTFPHHNTNTVPASTRTKGFGSAAVTGVSAPALRSQIPLLGLKSWTTLV